MRNARLVFEIALLVAADTDHLADMGRMRDMDRDLDRDHRTVGPTGERILMTTATARTRKAMAAVIITTRIGKRSDSCDATTAKIATKWPSDDYNNFE